MKRERGLRSLGVMVALFVPIARAQSLPTIQPPTQTWIYDFGGAFFAPVPAAPELNLGANFSIELWAMLDLDAVDGQYMRLFSKSNAYELDFEAGTHQLSYSQPGGNVHASQALLPGQWYHIAITSNNLQITLYLNGQPQGTFMATGQPPISSFPLVLGGQAYGDGSSYCCGFPGSLRQLRIWGRALQPSEIPQYATELLTGSEPGLIADWPLDDGQGLTLREVGPNRMALQLIYGNPALFVFPAWLRTALLEGGPYFQIQSLTASQNTIQSPTLSIPIDFDSDGNIDLLVCQGLTATAQPCAAFHNDGQGNFGDVTARVLGPQPPEIITPRDYCVADFNGDGRQDVFIANTGECYPACGYNGGQSVLLLQTADGRLQDATAAAGLPQENIFTHNVACGDIDGNGTIDLYLANIDVPPSIYLNDGKGHFTSGDPSRLPALLGTGGFDIYPAAKFIDLNHDGRLHLFLGSGDTRNNPHDLLLLNDGHGFFSVAPDNALPTRYGGRNWGTVSARVVDMDGDGWPDLVNAVNGPGYCEGAVQILLNNHDGTFRDATNLIAQPAWPRSSSPCSQLPYVDPLYTADFNGDGLPDILVHGNSQPSRLFLSTGTAGGGRLLEATELLPHTTPAAIAVADFNGDGALDIAAWINCCNSALRLESWLRTRSFQFTPDLIPPSPNGPSFLRGTVLNSADFTADALAPGQLVSIFGTGLGPDTLAVASPDGGSFPTQLAGTRVLFNNTAAPVLFTSAGEVGAIVPFSTLPGVRSDVVVENQGTQSPPVSIFVDAAAPAMFTADGSGAGAGAVQNFDPATGALTLNTSQNPIAAGGTVIAYITGGGATNPPSVDGALATSGGQMTLPVLAALDFWAADSQGPPPCGSSQVCQAVNVLYAGPAPGLVAGVTQVNVRLPDTASAGSHFLGVMVRGVWTQWLVTIWVR